MIKFIPSNSRYVSKKDEFIKYLTLSSTSKTNEITCKEAQDQISQCNISHVDSLIIKLKCTIIIEDTPLLLCSKVILIFDINGFIKPSDTCTSNALVSLDNVDSISINGINSNDTRVSRISGLDKKIVGIYIKNSTSIHMDSLCIENCFLGGVVIESSLPNSLDKSSSITRCFINNCSQGITITSSVSHICANNRFTGNKILGLLVQGATALVIGNTFENNTCDLFINYKNGLIVENTFKNAASSSLSTPLFQISEKSINNIIYQNNINCNLISLVGNCNRFNSFIGNIFKLNENFKELSRVDINSSSSIFDTSNLLDSYVKSPILLPYQFDIYIWGSLDVNTPSKIEIIQEGIAAARSICPRESILVVRVDGHYISQSRKGLSVPINTCLLLNGSIVADVNTLANMDTSSYPPSDKSYLISLAQSGQVYFSGGTLDCKGVVDNAIHALGDVSKNTDASDVILVDSVKIINSKADAVHLKGRKSTASFIIQNCHISNSGMRGIWVHVASNVFLLKNMCRENKKDGIDFDAGGKFSVAIGNLCSENSRHGIFVEEGCSNCIIVGNECVKNVWSGVHVWNEAVNGCTNNNMIAFNKCSYNNRGISVGGRDEGKTCKNNLFYNNTCCKNRNEGIVTGNKHSHENTFVNSIVSENKANPEINHFNPDKSISIQFNVPSSMISSSK